VEGRCGGEEESRRRVPLGLCPRPVQRRCSRLAHTPAQAAQAAGRGVLTIQVRLVVCLGGEGFRDGKRLLHQQLLRCLAQRDLAPPRRCAGRVPRYSYPVPAWSRSRGNAGPCPRRMSPARPNEAHEVREAVQPKKARGGHVHVIASRSLRTGEGGVGALVRFRWKRSARQAAVEATVKKDQIAIWAAAPGIPARADQTEATVSASV